MCLAILNFFERVSTEVLADQNLATVQLNYKQAKISDSPDSERDTHIVFIVMLNPTKKPTSATGRYPAAAIRTTNPTRSCKSWPLL